METKHSSLNNEVKISSLTSFSKFQAVQMERKYILVGRLHDSLFFWKNKKLEVVSSVEEFPTRLYQVNSEVFSILCLLVSESFVEVQNQPILQISCRMLGVLSWISWTLLEHYIHPGFAGFIVWWPSVK